MLDCRYICPTVLHRIFRSFRRRWRKTGRYGSSVYRVCSPGKAGKLRLQPDDPLLERPLSRRGLRGSFAGLWLMKRNPCRWCLAARRPTGMENGHQLWLRDAWAIGVNARYVIGIWTGNRTARPLLVSLALPVPYRC